MAVQLVQVCGHGPPGADLQTRSETGSLGPHGLIANQKPTVGSTIKSSYKCHFPALLWWIAFSYEKLTMSVS